MRETVVCYLLRGDSLLLGYKQQGFGAGKYAGFGGKVEPGETPVAAMVRELAEETGLRLTAEALQQVGVIDFSFPAQPAWSQRMYAYLVWDWQGEAQESREMRPEWFPLAAPPFDRMWSDARYWLPAILAGGQITAAITFAADNEQVAQWRVEAIR